MIFSAITVSDPSVCVRDDRKGIDWRKAGYNTLEQEEGRLESPTISYKNIPHAQ